MYSSFNTCSSMPKGGWELLPVAFNMPKMPIFQIGFVARVLTAFLPKSKPANVMAPEVSAPKVAAD